MKQRTPSSIVRQFLDTCDVDAKDGTVIVFRWATSHSPTITATLSITDAENLAERLLIAAREARGDTPQHPNRKAAQ